MLDALREKIVKDFTQFWAVNDEAHQVRHFTNVEVCGNAINDRLGLGFDPKLIMLVAHFHDMFAWSRHNHHQMSARWVDTTDYPPIADLTLEEKLRVYWGCLQHRASFKGDFKSRFSELMNAADRELPGDVEGMIERAVLYRMARGMSREEAYAPAVQHIQEKFAEGGYCRYPKLYLSVFGDELAKQRLDIKNL